MFRRSNQSSSQYATTPSSGTTTSATASVVSGRLRHAWNIFEFLYDNRLPLYEFIAVCLAIAIGLFVRYVTQGPITPRHASILGLPGEMYLRALECLALPLMCSGMVTAMSRLRVWRLGYVGVRIMGYCTITTVLAASMAALLTLAARPGLYVDLFDNSSNDLAADSFITDSINDAVRNTIPDNIVEAVIVTHETELIKSYFANGTLKPTAEWIVTDYIKREANVKGILCFFTYVGICLGSLDQSFYLIQEMFDSITEAAAQCTRFVIWFSPVAFFSRMLTTILQVESFLPIDQHKLFIATFIGALLFHISITVPIVFFIGSRRFPFKIYFYMADSVLTAIVSSSSYIAFPVTFHCMDSKLHTPRVITLYFLPLGNTFNMDGGSMFVAASTLYIAQGLTLPYLEPSNSVLLVLCSALLSAIVPGITDGLMSSIMAIPYKIFDIPTRYITTLQDVEWLLDPLRTSVNVIMDAVGASLIHHLSAHILEAEMDDI